MIKKWEFFSTMSEKVFFDLSSGREHCSLRIFLDYYYSSFIQDKFFLEMAFSYPSLAQELQHYSLK